MQTYMYIHRYSYTHMCNRTRAIVADTHALDIAQTRCNASITGWAADSVSNAAFFRKDRPPHVTGRQRLPGV